MNRLRLSWGAFKNMLRAAARDPLWAFLALIAMPFRIWKRLLGFMFILFNVTFVIGMGGGHFLEQMGFERGSVTLGVQCSREDRDEWRVLKLDGVQFDWRDDGRVLLTWRVRFPLPDAGETKLILTRVRLKAPETEAAARETA